MKLWASAVLGTWAALETSTVFEVQSDHEKHPALEKEIRLHLKAGGPVPLHAEPLVGKQKRTNHRDEK